MADFLPPLDIRRLYDAFNAPVTQFDCGKKCAPHNPDGSGKPVCCDICQAVPVAYKQEWQYLQPHTNLWHLWRGDECPEDPSDPSNLQADTPQHLLLLACKGPALCQRQYRASSCRQFPFFPFVTSDDRFIGLAYEWDFEPTCWVISHLDAVTSTYRQEFIHFYDEMFSLWPEEFESYAALSDDMREAFARQKRRIPILHRNGGLYLLSPANERLRRVEVSALKKFGPYRQK
ncbi:MAG: hypothetical protein NTZ48_04130 [Candidatus Omnitrophica bacterium]|nr:hypothetical protein [Candidatus Omnitrophota bacterium]